MIVVSIIGMITAISIPAILRSRAFAPSFTITGVPTSTSSGLKTYWSDPSCLIRFQNDGTVADSGSFR